MKYINKFSTNTEYQAFTEGGGYVTPNICYVTELKGLKFKPKEKSGPVLITFYIGGVECFAEKGMTWGEWFNSKYYSPFNVNGWYITEKIFTVVAQVNSTDVIIENNNYIIPPNN